MKSKNKVMIWIGGITGSWMALNAGSVQFATNTTGTTTTVVINHNEDYGSVKSEEVVLNKAGSNWTLMRKNLQDDAHFSLAQPTLAKFVIDGLTLQLTPTLDLSLSGAYDGYMCIDHPNKVLIAKGQTLTVSENFFLNKAILFENQGTLTVDKNWLCLLTAVKNSGMITVKQGWQVMSLQTFENTASGKFTMQQTDILSLGTKITNMGQMNCILDFNGEPCDFTNHAGEVRVGGNATLKSLVNKSETEPAVGGFVEVKKEFFDNQGELLTQVPATLKNYTGKFRDNSQSSNVWVGYRRMQHLQQNFTSKEGKHSSLLIGGDCILIGQSTLRYSNIFVGGKVQIKNTLTLYGVQILKKTIEAAFYHQDIRGCRHGFRGHPHYHDYWFGDIAENISSLELIPSTLEVLGTVTGKVETFVNGKADSAQPGVVKATETALMQHKSKLEQIAQDADILPMLADPEVYAAELQELKTNPVFATMIRLQEKRKLVSATNSTMPSRMGSPGLN